MPLKYETLAEAERSFSWNEAWELVSGTPESINIANECLNRHSGDCVRLKFTDGSTEKIRYEELASKSSQFAHLLEDLGVEKGDRVAMMMNPSTEFFSSFFGAVKRGAVAVPCSELFGPDALEHRIGSSEPSVLVSTDNIIENINTSQVDHTISKNTLEDEISNSPTTYDTSTRGDDDIFIQFTSGTTGKPEAHVYQHESVVYYAQAMDLIFDFQGYESCFTTSSTGWGTGIWIGMCTPLMFGVPAGFYSGKFDAELVLETLEEFDVNTLLGVVPTAYRKLIDVMDDISYTHKLDKANYTGEPIDESLSQQIEATFGAFPRSIYGATELRSFVTVDYAFEDYEFRHGSMGKPIPGAEVTVVDESGEEKPPGEIGSIAIRRKDDWIISDDAAFYDEEGYFWSAGRIDDTIISAGYTIGPQEVEESLRTHQSVSDAGVIGVPDEERNEIVKAFVELENSHSAQGDLRSELQDYVRSELSKHEYPREIEFIDELPKIPNGKTDRKKLHEIEEYNKGRTTNISTLDDT
jgi:acetyl-CoA synthetase